MNYTCTFSNDKNTFTCSINHANHVIEHFAATPTPVPPIYISYNHQYIDPSANTLRFLNTDSHTCKSLCSNDKNCGGFVFSDATSNGDLPSYSCWLKDNNIKTYLNNYETIYNANYVMFIKQ